LFSMGMSAHFRAFLMKSPSRFLLIAASLLGFSGVMLGAFGAHALKNALEATGQMKNWEKAVFYQLIHAAALLALAHQPSQTSKRIGTCWTTGTILFSGSLYCLALGGPIKFLWPITPLGGLALLAGWLLLAWTAIRQADA
jgi:uncharacterized membrane protein YgdD (TMEM256/DUF423 family)